MPYIEPDRKTGILTYRRRIPTDLQPVLNKKSFNRSLGTSRRPEANRLGIEAGREFDALIADTRQRLADNGVGLSRDGAQRPVIDPTAAFDAIQRWCEAETGKAALEVANGVRDEDQARRVQRSNLIVALRGSDRFRGYASVPNFDDRLVEALRAKGVSISTDHPILKVLRPAFRDAWLQVEEALDRMQRGGGGDWDWAARPEPVRENASESRTPKGIGGPKLSEMVERWATAEGIPGARRPAKRSTIEARRGERYFIRLHGDIPVREITGEHAFALRKALMHDDDGEPRPVQARTINKVLNLLSGVMKFAKRAGVFADMHWTNPFGMAKLEEDPSAAEPYQPFSADDLKKLFASPVFAEGYRPVRGRGDTAKFAPLVGLFSGARRGEILPLFVRDVFPDPDTGIWCIRFSHDDGKSLKTSSSYRITPVHPLLADLGFLDFVRRRAEAVGPDGSLWPGFEDRKKLATKMNRWGEWFSAYLAKHVVEHPEKKFHSFRGTFKRVARDSVPENVIDRLVGHAHVSAGSRYGRKKLGFGLFDSGINLNRLNEYIKQINFEQVIGPSSSGKGSA